MKLRFSKREVEPAKKRSVNLIINSDFGKKRITLRIKPRKVSIIQQQNVVPTGYFGTVQQVQPVQAPIQALPGTQVGLGYYYPFVPYLHEHMRGSEEPEIEEVKVEGFKIPDTVAPPVIEELATEEFTELGKINITYPLIPSSPKEGEKVYAYAHIYFNPKLNEVVYDVVEPFLDEANKAVLEQIKDYIREKIDVNFVQVRGGANEYINNVFENAVRYFKIRSKETEDVLKYYVIRDFIGLEKIEPLLKDKQIEDISCDGLYISLYVYHRDSRLGSLRTNIVFTDKDELDSFVSKIAERCGKVISVAKPLLDGALPDGSRVQATLSSDIARHGSNFTIRMFTEKPLTPTHMIKFGTCDLKLLSYFWFLIEYNQNFLISGGTATGKTSMLNVLSLFIKSQMKIVSIEDTPEIKLPHSHWVPEVARTAISEEGKVDMYELLRESLRQRPDYIIVGEVRGREAYVLFQQLAVGHAGLATIHAENMQKLIDRLTTAPISLPVNLIENIDVIIFLKRVKQGKIYKRRIASVVEVVAYNRDKNSIISNEVFRWDPRTDKYIVTNKSYLLKKVSELTGLTEGEMSEDIKRKSAVLKWILEKNFLDYVKVGHAFNLFYTVPDFLLQRIGYA